MLVGLNHITIAVSNLERSFAFYTQVLGMKPHVRWDGGAYLCLGDIWFCLSCDNVAPSRDYSHIALDIAAEDFAFFADKLRAENVEEWKQNKSEGNSLYFLDPDGHKLEVHCGSLQSRLDSLLIKPYKGLEWFE